MNTYTAADVRHWAKKYVDSFVAEANKKGHTFLAREADRHVSGFITFFTAIDDEITRSRREDAD